MSDVLHWENSPGNLDLMAILDTYERIFSRHRTNDRDQFIWSTLPMCAFLIVHLVYMSPQDGIKSVLVLCCLRYYVNFSAFYILLIVFFGYPYSASVKYYVREIDLRQQCAIYVLRFFSLQNVYSIMVYYSRFNTKKCEVYCCGNIRLNVSPCKLTNRRVNYSSVCGAFSSIVMLIWISTK